jgi:hypothetical protein
VLEKASFEIVRFVSKMDRFLYRRVRQELGFGSVIR